MKLVPELGIAAPELGWVPSPTFALRRRAILDRVQAWRPGRVLEMGCGAGAILYDLAERGFEGLGVETSDQARRVARQILAVCNQVQVLEKIPDDAHEFDYLLSFEVLEHIEDDSAALTGWVERLRPGGICLLSVPAHPEHWNVTDVLAGHYRRYDRQGFLDLVTSCGLTPTYVSTYGWPATWLIEHLRNLVRSRQISKQGLSIDDIERGDVERTAESGVERSTESKLYPYYGGLMGRFSFRLMGSLQRLFYSSDGGISYLLEARKE